MLFYFSLMIVVDAVPHIVVDGGLRNSHIGSSSLHSLAVVLMGFRSLWHPSGLDGVEIACGLVVLVDAMFGLALPGQDPATGFLGFLKRLFWGLSRSQCATKTALCDVAPGPLIRARTAAAAQRQLVVAQYAAADHSNVVADRVLPRASRPLAGEQRSRSVDAPDPLRRELAQVSRPIADLVQRVLRPSLPSCSVKAVLQPISVAGTSQTAAPQIVGLGAFPQLIVRVLLLKLA